MCRSRRELSNEYLLAKIGVDTAENEPLEVWGKIQFNIRLLSPRTLSTAGPSRPRRSPPRPAPSPRPPPACPRAARPAPGPRAGRAAAPRRPRGRGARGRGRRGPAAPGAPPRPRERWRPTRQTLERSFSAVSKRNFASKYALENSRRDLQNTILCTVLEANPKKRGKSFAPFSKLNFLFEHLLTNCQFCCQTLLNLSKFR